MDIKSDIFSLARSYDFCCYGVVDRDLLESLKLPFRLNDFIEKGYHGEMKWLARLISLRSNVFSLSSDINSVIVLGVDYTPQTDPLFQLKNHSHAAISVYAQSRDYHKVIRRRLKLLSKSIEDRYSCYCRFHVDTAPLMEKPLAACAGLGWQGKHTNLVSRDFGSWLFLGVILTSLRLDYDNKEKFSTPSVSKKFSTPSVSKKSSTSSDGIKNYCGSCSKCISICPTNAFVAPYKLDARRCISYLTIEYKGIISLELRSMMGNRIFGCDDCLSVCPWNKFARKTSEFKRDFGRSYMSNLSLSHLIHFDKNDFYNFFAGSAVIRAGFESFMRNILIAIGNSGNSNLVVPLWRFLASKSDIIRATAIWSFVRCCSVDTSCFSLILFAYNKFALDEKNLECVSEWRWVKENYF